MMMRFGLKPRWSGAFSLLLLLLLLLLVAGGASQAAVPGQLIVRSGAWLVLIVAILAGIKPQFAPLRPVFLFLLAALALPLLQLLPLPPALWSALPGRALFAAPPMDPTLWRPVSLSPWHSFQSASALIVPLVACYLLSALPARDYRRLPALLLAGISACLLSGLLQIAGQGIALPWINGDPDAVRGVFANRNHFALFLAMGCVVAPVWACSASARSSSTHGRTHSYWRWGIALGAIALFVLGLLASGSRAGLLLGLLGLLLGLAISWGRLRQTFAKAPRWAFPLALLGLCAVPALFVTLSVFEDRAIAINRALTLDAGDDLRAQALPTVLHMAQHYAPVGTGFGTFDPVFRLHEPFELLRHRYFNHAHNDLLEILVEGGLPAGLLLLAVLVWYARTSAQAWRGSFQADGSGQAGARVEITQRQRLGSALILLLLAASLLDYPARTPLLMFTLITAAALLKAPHSEAAD